MPHKAYEKLCASLLNLPLESVRVAESGEIQISEDLSDLSSEQQSTLGLLQCRLEVELSLSKRLEEARLKSEKLAQSLASRDELFNDFGHELRSPLNAVLNLSQILSETTLPDEISDIVSTVCHSAQHVSRLVEDALCLRALDRGQVKVNPSVLHPQAYFSALVQELSLDEKFYDTSLSHRIDEKLPSQIVLDPETMRQIILGMTYYIFRTAAKRIEVLFSWEKSGLSFSVHTPDFSLADPERSALLSSWSELAKRGTSNAGLSMAVVNSLVRLMSGSLDISEGTVSGSNFRVWVPASIHHDRGPQPSFSGNSEDIRILAVDDDPTSLLVLKHVVKKLGYRLESAETGTTALRKLASEKYSLLLLDLRMPGMDGLQVARTVRNELELDVPIVAMSGDTTPLARQQALDVGMIDFLPKPLRRERLSQVLSKILHP